MESYIQIKSGTELKIDNRIYKCLGFWSIGNKIVEYIFLSPAGVEFKLKYDFVQERVKNKIYLKI